VALLSPSLFALHEDGKGIEKSTSLVHGLGLAQTKEHEAWLDLVMEASGVTDAIEYLKDEKIKKSLTGIMFDEEMKSETGQPLYFTKKNVSEIFGEKETRKIDTFEELQGTYTPDQVRALAPLHKFLTNQQSALLISRDISLSDLREIMRIVESRSALQVFVPVILSPRALSPLIVNPLIFAPVILSPLALHPFILAPGVFNPFILSPMVLSPFILSPQVFSPAILSPFVLNPFIGTPTVGSPLILSPFALSPIIMSPQIMFAAILSPFVLSPLPWSPLIFAEVVLSP
ncbi:hypothetical protein PENTCL1PPCAC_14772, partial [Pristionchus entomophagus]